MSKVTYCHIGTHITCQVRTVLVGLVVHDLEIFSLGGPTVEVDLVKIMASKKLSYLCRKFFLKFFLHWSTPHHILCPKMHFLENFYIPPEKTLGFLATNHDE